MTDKPRSTLKPDEPEIIRDLSQLQEVEISVQGKGYLLRTETQGVTGKVARACGVAMPPTLRKI